MKVILLGPPGAGKGTQAARLAGKLGVNRMSSGDLFRDHQARNTDLGRLARSYMERGVLVPDDVTIKMVMAWIKAPEQVKGFVLDGFPRTLVQANALDREMEGASPIDRVLYIGVSEDELNRRLTGRLICRDCQTPYHRHSSPPKSPDRCNNCGGGLYQREDDKEEAVLQRDQGVPRGDRAPGGLLPKGGQARRNRRRGADRRHWPGPGRRSMMTGARTPTSVPRSMLPPRRTMSGTRPVLYNLCEPIR